MVSNLIVRTTHSNTQQILGGEQISTVSQSDQGWTPTRQAALLPELQHNIRLLVEMTEEDIHKIDREIRHAKDKVANLEHTRNQLQAVTLREKQGVEQSAQVRHKDPSPAPYIRVHNIRTLGTDMNGFFFFN